MSNLTNDLIWLAGMFEGEGTTGLFKYRRGQNEKSARGNWRITTYFLITNNDPIIIDETRRILSSIGVESYILQRERPKDKDWNLGYQICCKNFAGVHKALSFLYPYLRGSKKSIANMVMGFIESREFGKTRNPYTTEEHQLYEDVKMINQRGRGKEFEPSETLRQALANIAKAISGEEKVQTSMKVGEEIPLD